MSKKQSTRKLVATALGALAADIAAPALAQDASVPQTPPVVAAPEPTPPIVEAPASAPMVQAPAPAPEPFQLKVPELDPVPAPTVRTARVQSAPRATSRATPVRAPAPSKATAPTEPRPITPEAPIAPVAAAPVARAPEASITTPATAPDTTADWMLIGGAAGLGLLGMAGGTALAMRRRREAMTPERVDPATAPVAPTLTPAPLPAAAPSLAERGIVGRHQAAAMVGPTADNPFLTRRARLRHARFLDRQEALAMAPAETPMVADPVTEPAEQRAEATQVTYSFGKGDRRFGFGPPVLR